MDDTDEDDDSEMDLLLWISTPISSDRSSRRRLRYLVIGVHLVLYHYHCLPFFDIKRFNFQFSFHFFFIFNWLSINLFLLLDVRVKGPPWLYQFQLIQRDPIHFQRNIKQ